MQFEKTPPAPQIRLPRRWSRGCRDPTEDVELCAAVHPKRAAFMQPLCASRARVLNYVDNMPLQIYQLHVVDTTVDRLTALPALVASPTDVSAGSKPKHIPGLVAHGNGDLCSLFGRGSLGHAHATLSTMNEHCCTARTMRMLQIPQAARI